MNESNENRFGYKHTPIGWIPEEWAIKKIGDISSLNPPRKELTDENAVSFVAMADVSEDGKVINESTRLYKDVKNGFSYFENNDILVAKITPCFENGKGALVQNLSNTVGFGSTEFHVIRTQKQTLPEYIYYHTRMCSFRLTGKQNMVGSAGHRRVPADFIETYKIALPPLPEQHGITTILSTWDEAISKTQQLIAQLQERNKGLMQQLLMPQEGWNTYRIGDLLKEVKRPVDWDDNELYHLISVRRRSGGAFFRESLFGKQILTKQLYTVKEGDFLISKMQIVHGASAIVPTSLNGMKVSGSYIVIHGKDEAILDMNFFNWLSKTKWFYRLTYISSYGVHIEKMTFDYDDFKRRKIMLPTIEQQRNAVRILQKSAEEIIFYEQKLNILQLQKKGLMQKLLTGEVRVRVPQKSKATL